MKRTRTRGAAAGIGCVLGIGLLAFAACSGSSSPDAASSGSGGATIASGAGGAHAPDASGAGGADAPDGGSDADATPCATMCNGACTDVLSDLANCGSCGNACTTDGGADQVSCDDGQCHTFQSLGSFPVCNGLLGASDPTLYCISTLSLISETVSGVVGPILHTFPGLGLSFVHGPQDGSIAWLESNAGDTSGQTNELSFGGGLTMGPRVGFQDGFYPSPQGLIISNQGSSYAGGPPSAGAIACGSTFLTVPPPVTAPGFLVGGHSMPLFLDFAGNFYWWQLENVDASDVGTGSILRSRCNSPDPNPPVETLVAATPALSSYEVVGTADTLYFPLSTGYLSVPLMGGATSTVPLPVDPAWSWTPGVSGNYTLYLVGLSTAGPPYQFRIATATPTLGVKAILGTLTCNVNITEPQQVSIVSDSKYVYVQGCMNDVIYRMAL